MHMTNTFWLWNNKTFVNRALPFGLRSVPKIFSTIADALAWALQCARVNNQIHYREDFLLLGSPNSNDRARALTTAIDVLSHLGVPVTHLKMERPVTSVVFFVVIDTMNFQLKLLTE